MHGWAAINHKLLYKHENDIPKPFKRDLFRLSALIELADEQFERLREERKGYAGKVLKETDDGSFIIDETKELNVDSFLALMEKHFPNYQGQEDASDIIDNIKSCGLSLFQFYEKLLISLPYLKNIEKEEFELENSYYSDGGNGCWNIYALTTTILDLTVENHLEESDHPDEIYEISKKYRDQIT